MSPEAPVGPVTEVKQGPIVDDNVLVSDKKNKQNKQTKTLF